MPTVGDQAPTFDCTAVVDGNVVQLDWGQLHENKILLLLFDSVEFDSLSPDDIAALSSAQGRIGRLQAKLAIVCRDHVFEILTWTNRVTVESATSDIRFPIIVDTDHWISSVYDMISGSGQALWGHAIVDAVGRLRQVVTHADPVGANVDELVRCITSISEEACDVGDACER